MKHLWLVSCLIFAISPNATAMEIRSVGHIDCGSFLAACDESKLSLNCQAQSAFAEGYISGVSWENEIPLREFESDTVKYALIKYCSENPLTDTQEGAAWILRQLM